MLRFHWLLAVLTAVLLLPPLGQAHAQATGSVSGQVVSAATGEPLRGAQVFLEGTGHGTLTGGDGTYTIPNVRPGTYNVVVRMIGHADGRQANQTVRAGETASIDFQLRTSALALQEVVVTGVADPIEGVRVPFTVSRVNVEDMPVPATNPVATLQGRIPGARVQGTSGQPGTGMNVRLRARNSVNTSEAPLMVVDGVIQGANIVDIDPQDIETIEVVRGAAAASLYGSRAQAGVIQITTRRGQSIAAGQTRITARTEYGFSQVPRVPGLAMHHPFHVDAQGQWIDRDGNPVDRESRVIQPSRMMDNPYTGPVYNHLDLFFDPGQFFNTTVSVGRNSEDTNFYISAADNRETGVVPEFNQGYHRQNVRFNLDHRIRDDLTVGFTSYHMKSAREVLHGNPFFALRFISPDVDLMQPNPDGEPFHIQPDPAQLEPNPLYAASVVDDWQYRARTQGSINLRYNPFSWFNVDGLFAYDRSDRERSRFYPKGYKTMGPSVLNDGDFTRAHSFDETLNGHVQGVFIQAFGDLTTRTRLRYGFETEEFESQEARAREFRVQGVRSLNAGAQEFVGGSSSRVRSEGVSLNTGLDFGGRYIADLLVRRDGSSLFGPDDRWQTYYRAAFSYLMSEEPWWPVRDITAFKPRYSIGTAGSRPGFAWRYETWNIGTTGPSKGTLGNRLLRPEHTTEQDMGLDIIFRDRVSLELTRATSVVEDQLIPMPLPGFVGYNSQWQNAGTVETTAYEAALEAALVQRPGLDWRMGLVADRSESVLTDWQRTCYSTSTFYRCEGESFSTMRGRQVVTGHDQLHERHTGSHGQFQVNDDGYLVPVGDSDFTAGRWGERVTIDGVEYDWGIPIFQLDEEGNIDNLAIIGDANPRFNLGWTNDVTWRGLRFASLVDMRIGGDVYNLTRQWPYRDNMSPDQVQAGKPEELKKPIDYYQRLYAATATNSHFVEDGSFAKLRELSLSYRLGADQLGRLGPLGAIGMDALTLQLIGRNLLTVTNYSGIDPEVGATGAGGPTENPFDDFSYPNFRTFTFSAQVQF
jgi:TonB-linked SusC/RagA family outer membrane protein